MSKAKVRVRFAPSPTGSLHLGGVRTALFNWLFARHQEGVFILRIEDTDRERLVSESQQQITASLRWLGLDWDEGIEQGGSHGPYVQSERLKIYQAQAQKLLEQGALYRCWCQEERLAKLRRQAQSERRAFKYDRYCLKHPQALSSPHVLRFKIPAGDKISWQDAVKGPIDFEIKDQDDFVTIKSDGYPTYNFANVVDDHLMEISHVIRGDEFVASTPKHLLLYRAFDWQPPQFAHLPTVLGPDRAKLSKRHGALSLLEYRDRGYLPEAIINFLALLGWNEGRGTTKEIYSVKELIKAFSLERVQASPAVFDPERLNWLNGQYIRSLPAAELAKLAQPFWPKAAAKSGAAYRKRVLALMQERLKFLAELPELTEFFFTDPAVDPVQLVSGLDRQSAATYLAKTQQTLAATDLSATALEKTLRSLATQLKLKPGDLFRLIRVAVTGRTAAPGLFETLVALGKPTALRRLAASIKSLSD